MRTFGEIKINYALLYIHTCNLVISKYNKYIYVYIELYQLQQTGLK